MIDTAKKLDEVYASELLFKEFLGIDSPDAFRRLKDKGLVVFNDEDGGQVCVLASLKKQIDALTDEERALNIKLKKSRQENIELDSKKRNFLLELQRGEHLKTKAVFSSLTNVLYQLWQRRGEINLDSKNEAKETKTAELDVLFMRVNNFVLDSFEGAIRREEGESVEGDSGVADG